MFDWTNDERAQSMQIGFILIFGILVLLLTMYQANVVPEQNKKAEITHSNEIEYEFEDIESYITNTGMDGKPSTKVYPMSMSYQPRLFAINLPQPSGTISTSSLNNIIISNSSIDDHNIPTRYLEYDVDYGYYKNPPTYTYETGFTYRNFDDGQTAVSPNQFILNDGFSIVALQGKYNETSYNSEKLRFERTDTLVEYEITNPEITVPTKLDNEEWTEFASEKPNLEVLSYDESEETVTLSREGTMPLYLSSVSLSDDADGGVNHEDIDLPVSDSEEEEEEQDPELSVTASENGNSGKYVFTWETDPEVDGASISLYVNGELIESDLSQTETEYDYKRDRGDTNVEVRLIDENGDEITRDSTTI